MERQYPSHPMVGVGTLIKKGDEILLVQRRYEPDTELWTIPGGLVELGEGVRDAARRETREETSLDVEIKRLLDVVDRVIHDEEGRIRYHYILVDFLAYPIGGELKISPDELLAAQWVSLEEIDRYPLPRELKCLIENIKENNV